MTTSASTKLIYTFAEGNAQMRKLLGGKGAGLAEMTNAGLPVPPGFTITTEACNAYYAAGKELPDGLWDEVVAHMHRARAADRQALRRRRRTRCSSASARAPSSRCPG